MLIKDVYKKIEELEKDRRNFLNIQEFCSGYMSTNPNDTEHTRIYCALEDRAKLNEPLRNLVSKTIVNIDIEIERLKKIIANTNIKID